MAIASRLLRSLPIVDAAEQAAAQAWIPLECYQMGRGNRLGRMDTLDLGGQQVVRERQAVAVQKLGATPANVCTVSCCTLDPAFRFSELCAGGTDTVFFMPGDTEFDIYVPAGAQTRYVGFDQEAFLGAARILDPQRWENAPRHLLPVPGARRAALEAAVDSWFEAIAALAATDAVPDAGAMRRMLLQNIATIAAAAQPDAELPPLERSRAFHVCRAARIFVEDRLADNRPPTIVDVCAWTGVSERTLQYAFRTYIAMSPHAYLRLCRLNRVRACLRAADPQAATVTQVATRFGFLHLGRFAGDYRRTFGESPSATLAS